MPTQCVYLDVYSAETRKPHNKVYDHMLAVNVRRSCGRGCLGLTRLRLNALLRATIQAITGEENGYSDC